MKVHLSKCKEKGLEALEIYCNKNDKLIEMRNKNNRLIAVGLSIKSFQNLKANNGFNLYNSIKILSPIYNEARSEQQRLDNYCKEIVLYDTILSSYEGKIIHKNDKYNETEEYWFKCYINYLKNKELFIPWDLINKHEKGNKNLPGLAK